MDFSAELDRFDPDPRLREWVLAQLRSRDLKIQQLTLQLAHHNRIRFGVNTTTLC